MLRRAAFAAICTGLAASAVVLAPAAHADTVATIFNYTGAEQTFAVPAGVTSVHVVAVGGHGGSSLDGFVNPVGGSGATAAADPPVTPGHTLFVEVGGNGKDSNGSADGTGGFNGGGTGKDILGVGVGGGGASDVRTLAAADANTLGSRLLVAGGGGGAASGVAGGAGGLAGSPGEDLGAACADSGQAGGGGTQSAVGSGGHGNPTPGGDGASGVDGTGGNGGTNAVVPAYAGGGGYFGGGGGGGGNPASTCGAAGGGGSSFGTGATFGTDSSGTPQITISYVVPRAPQAITEPVSNVGLYGVTMNGVVNPRASRRATTSSWRSRPGTTGPP